MRTWLIAAAGLLVATPVSGQWSEPVTLASQIAAYGAGPELVPAGGDTLWALWVGLARPSWLQARAFTGDSWYDTEFVASGQYGVYWPAGIVDGSGHLVAAFYEGSYPVEGRVSQDSWAIYTATRTDTGWTRPEFTHAMMTATFPYEIWLGKDQDGELGMVWDQNGGGIESKDSVMFSRRTAFGWTERICLAPGRYPDVNCSGGSLIPGDSTAFVIAYARWDDPDTSRVLVWDLGDSLVHAPAVFWGDRPILARGQHVRFLAHRRLDSIFGSENRGQGWQAPQLVGTGAGWGGPSLCVDPLGWGWVCWPDSFQQAVLASYNDAAGWSEPETVATFSSLGASRIAADERGRLHCVWFDHEGGSGGRLRHAYRLERPGLEEARLKAGRAGVEPTFVRGVLRLSAGADAVLLDVSGRRVTDLQPGENDVSRLAPGVYFCRPTAGSASSVYKVILTR